MARATVPVPPAASSAGGSAPSEVRGYALVGAASGLIFAVLFAVSLVLVRQSPGLGGSDSDYTQFYTGGSDVLVTFGLYVVPFAGIAWLWHMTATRILIEAHPGPPSKIPFGLHLASGILFIAMMFAAAAAIGAPALWSVFSTVPPPSPEVARALTAVGYGLMFVYGVRAAGMYMITMTTTLRGTGILPRWLVALGYLAAAFLLVSTTFHPAVLLVFPAWVLVVNTTVLVHALRGR